MRIRVVVSLFALAAASCTPEDRANQSLSKNDEMSTAEPERKPVMVSLMAGEPKKQLFLVEPLRSLSYDDLATGLRDSGFPCERATAFNQLEENGKRMDVFKLDCVDQEYQITMLNDSTHIKRWTGNLLGE